jgi:hypothetical protein
VEADWSDKVLQTLYELSSHQLALQYATISKHHSDIPEDIILRMKLFVKSDFVRAFYFQVSLHAAERGSGLSIFLQKKVALLTIIKCLQREICGDRHDTLRETLLHILWEAIFTGWLVTHSFYFNSMQNE